MRNSKTFFCILITFVFLFLTVENAFAVSENIVPAIVKKFKQQSDNWFSSFQGAAYQLFILCLTLEIAVLGIRSAISVADIKETLQQFVMSVLTGALFFTIINNYKLFTNQIIGGLMKFAGSVTSTDLDTNDPLISAFHIVDVLITAMDGLTFWNDASTILGLVVSMFITFICFALLSAKFIVIKCEVMIGTVITLLLIPLGATKFFKSFAENGIKYVVASAFKLFSIYLILGIGFEFINSINLATSTGGEMESAFVLVGFSIVLLTVAMGIPDSIANLIHSSGVAGGGNLMAAARTVAMAATPITIAGKGAGKMAGNMSGKMAGKVGETAKVFAKSVGIARKAGATGIRGTLNAANKIRSDARTEFAENKQPKDVSDVLNSKKASIDKVNKK